MKSIPWIFWLCLLTFLGCESIQGAFAGDNDLNMADTAADNDEDGSPLKFQAGVWVYPRSNTSADRTVLELSNGKSTVLSDPGGNIWKLSLREGYTAANFDAAGYTQDWFPTSQDDEGQLFYYQAFASIPAPMPDPMIDSPAYCSVYLDAGTKRLYIWMYRTADMIVCPSIAEYKTWLPHTTTAPLPLTNSP